MADADEARQPLHVAATKTQPGSRLATHRAARAPSRGARLPLVPRVVLNSLANAGQPAPGPGQPGGTRATRPDRWQPGPASSPTSPFCADRAPDRPRTAPAGPPVADRAAAGHQIAHGALV